MIEQLDEENNSLHGVVADAFYMSFRAIKVACSSLASMMFQSAHCQIGPIDSWLVMEDGDFIAAIGLATSYYVGDA